MHVSRESPSPIHSSGSSGNLRELGSWDSLDDNYFTDEERRELTPVVLAEQKQIERTAFENRNESFTSWHRGNKTLKYGGSGVVYVAIDDVTGQLMACRQEAASANSKATDRFMREMNTLRLLRHNHIVQYKGSCVRDGKLCVLMEFCDGGSIACILSRFGALSDRLTARYTRHILSGLDYLHRHCIVHRNITCSTCLVTTLGVVKLSDFGQVRVYAPHQSQSFEGTLGYSAPEVFIKGVFARQSDIWSLGCCVLEMLTGALTMEDVPPEEAPDLGSGAKRLFARPAIPKDLNEDAQRFLDECLQPTYTKRPSARKLCTYAFVQEGLLSTGSDSHPVLPGDPAEMSENIASPDALLEMQAPYSPLGWLYQNKSHRNTALWFCEQEVKIEHFFGRYEDLELEKAYQKEFYSTICIRLRNFARVLVAPTLGFLFVYGSWSYSLKRLFAMGLLVLLALWSVGVGWMPLNGKWSTDLTQSTRNLFRIFQAIVIVISWEESAVVCFLIFCANSWLVRHIFFPSEAVPYFLLYLLLRYLNVAIDFFKEASVKEDIEGVMEGAMTSFMSYSCLVALCLWGLKMTSLQSRDHFASHYL